MTDINKKLLSLVMENKNLNEISEELNLSPKQICKRLASLKNSGYNIENTLLDSGTIEYSIINEPVIPAVHSATIKLVKDPYHFKAMVISDLQIGSCEDNLERLNYIYEYCIQHGINIIINTGDLIDGLSSYPQYINSVDQIEFLAKKYPYDKNILNIVCFGNHDIEVLKHYGLDISTLLKNARPDFISLGYGDGFINILQEHIVLKHSLAGNFPKQAEISFQKVSGKLFLRGHRHKMGVAYHHGNLMLNIPTLSDIIFDARPTLPGAVELDIDFMENGHWTNINAEHLVVTDKIFPVNEIEFSITQHSSTKLSEGEFTKKRQRRIIR